MGYIEIFEMNSNGAGWKNLDENSVLARYNVYCDGCVENARKSSTQVLPLKKSKHQKKEKVEESGHS
jgi:hypothetical protein